MIHSSHQKESSNCVCAFCCSVSVDYWLFWYFLKTWNLLKNIFFCRRKKTNTAAVWLVWIKTNELFSLQASNGLKRLSFVPATEEFFFFFQPVRSITMMTGIKESGKWSQVKANRLSWEEYLKQSVMLWKVSQCG